jgi:protochlorophyllide reductase
MKALINKGDYYVIAGVRDPERMKEIAETEGFDSNSYSVLPLDLASFDSTRDFVKNLNTVKKSRPLDRLVCNAAVYQPALPTPTYTADGFEAQLQTNHLSHFLLCSLLLNDMKKSKDARMIIVGSITGNDNTVGGGAVLPLADLGDLEGLAQGGQEPVAMIDGLAFDGAKAYKDSKMCNMMTANELHKRYHKSTGITFSTMYPGCIAETQLFREKRAWFRKIFPLFMKYVTGGYVGEEEAGERLAAVVDDERCKKSGVYWAWNGAAKTVGYLKNGKVSGAGGSGGELFENEPSAKVRDEVKGALMWQYSTQITGAKWPSK